MLGYNIRFGNESILSMEARAMLEGLHLAWAKRVKKIEVESNNVLLIELLQSGGKIYNSLVEVQPIHQILQRDWETKLRYIF